MVVFCSEARGGTGARHPYGREDRTPSLRLRSGGVPPKEDGFRRRILIRVRRPEYMLAVLFPPYGNRFNWTWTCCLNGYFLLHWFRSFCCRRRCLLLLSLISLCANCGRACRVASVCASRQGTMNDTPAADGRPTDDKKQSHVVITSSCDDLRC